MKICLCDWFNKEANSPIGEQDKVRQESQIQNAGKEKGGTTTHQPATEAAGNECATLIKVSSCGRA